MLNPSLRAPARPTLSPDRAFSAVMAAITREARASGVSVSALGALVAERLAANLEAAR